MTGEVVAGPPTHIVADWNYFLKHSDSKTSEIPFYFDKENWKINTGYRMRVSHIYNPSKFWVVTKESEVDTLHKYLHHFYSKFKEHYKIPPKNIKLNMYCVAYTDGAYYRALLVNVPFFINKKSWIFVFLIDFGFMAKVGADELYFLTTEMYTVPQLAIRATLSGMGPVNSVVWSTEAAAKVGNLINNKVLLGQITHKDDVNKVLYLKLAEYNWEKRCLDSINDTLVTERLAKQITVADVKEMKHSEKKKRSKWGKKVKLPFLSPDFFVIEKGACGDTVLGNAYLEQFACKKFF